MANIEKISAEVYDAKMEKASKIAKIIFNKAKNDLTIEYLVLGFKRLYLIFITRLEK